MCIFASKAVYYGCNHTCQKIKVNIIKSPDTKDYNNNLGKSNHITQFKGKKQQGNGKLS